MIQMNKGQLGKVAGNIYGCISGQTGSGQYASTGTAPRMNILTIYSGSIPTVNSGFVWNPSNYTGSALYENTNLVVKLLTVSGVSVGISLTAAITATATGSGVASWYAIHNGTGGAAIIGSLSANPNAADTMLLNTVSLAQGSSFTIMDLTIRVIG